MNEPLPTWWSSLVGSAGLLPSAFGLGAKATRSFDDVLKGAELEQGAARKGAEVEQGAARKRAERVAGLVVPVTAPTMPPVFRPGLVGLAPADPPTSAMPTPGTATRPPFTRLEPDPGKPTVAPAERPFEPLVKRTPTDRRPAAISELSTSAPNRAHRLPEQIHEALRATTRALELPDRPPEAPSAPTRALRPSEPMPEAVFPLAPPQPPRADGMAPVETVEPAEIAGPAAPAGPAGPVRPVGSVEPMEPAQPVQRTQRLERVHRVDHVDRVDRLDDAEPLDGTEPVATPVPAPARQASGAPSEPRMSRPAVPKADSRPVDPKGDRREPAPVADTPGPGSPVRDPGRDRVAEEPPRGHESDGDRPMPTLRDLVERPRRRSDVATPTPTPSRTPAEAPDEPAPQAETPADVLPEIRVPSDPLVPRDHTVQVDDVTVRIHTDQHRVDVQLTGPQSALEPMRDLGPELSRDLASSGFELGSFDLDHHDQPRQGSVPDEPDEPRAPARRAVALRRGRRVDRLV